MLASSGEITLHCKLYTLYVCDEMGFPYGTVAKAPRKEELFPSGPVLENSAGVL